MVTPVWWPGFRRAGRRPIALLRQLVIIGGILRWIGLVVAGVIGLVAPPKASLALVLLILAVAVYNSWAMLAVRNARDGSVLGIARTVTFLDQISCLVFLAIFSHLAGGSQSAFYVPVVIEAVAIDRLDGAIVAVAIFVLGVTAIQADGAILGHQPFDWTVVLVWSLIMLVVGAAMAAIDVISPGLVPSAETPAGPVSGVSAGVGPIGAGVRLPAREQEVLRLIAAGYSNAMIAERLHLSETTVKTYVENLLARLSVRNRAEAVAVASRLGLL
jgi:DNA-binding CsgD family transcriptional regulator